MQNIKPVILKSAKNLPPYTRIVQAYRNSLEELFFIRYPQYKPNSPGASALLQKFLGNTKIKPIWIYYPKQKTAVFTVPEKYFFELRTSRNRNLITTKEQQNFRNMSIGIAGLSVGSCVLSALVVSGGPKKIKIADFDTLEISNLNRIKAKLTDIGKNKIQISAGEVWDIDPFTQLELYDKGLTDKNLKKFLLAKPKLSAFIDEMDSLPLKVSARSLCKKNRIPVIMATDNGDSVVLDIERFDLEPKRKLFHGLLGNISPDSFKDLSYKQWLSLATKIVGPKYLTAKMQLSLLEIGKTLPAVPQLGAIAEVAGAAISLALRKISNSQPMPSGRYVISLEEKLTPNFFNKTSTRNRARSTQNFKKHFK